MSPQQREGLEQSIAWLQARRKWWMKEARRYRDRIAKEPWNRNGLEASLRYALGFASMASTRVGICKRELAAVCTCEPRCNCRRGCARGEPCVCRKARAA